MWEKNATKKNETHHHAHAAEHDNNHAAIPLRYPQIQKKTKHTR